MIAPRRTKLFLRPDNVEVFADIVTLTEQMADEKIRRGWWSEECLKEEPFDPVPIDRDWDWNSIAIEVDGKLLRSEKIAIVAGDDEAVQGAMMISTEPVKSELVQGKWALFVELLFTAPRNRPRLRKDESEFLLGVGTKLLSWGVWFSREKGCDGILRLDGSEEFVGWYENRGLQMLDLDHIIHDGNTYVPMELPFEAAQKFLASEWEV